MTSHLPSEEPSQDFEMQSDVVQEGRIGRNLSPDCGKRREKHLWISFFSICIMTLGGCMKTPSSKPDKTTMSSPTPSVQSTQAATATPSDQSVSLSDVELNLKRIPPYGDIPQFEGTVVNTGKSQIDKVFLRIKISEMKITPEELRDSNLMAFKLLTNLKPGESRYVTISLSMDRFCFTETPKDFQGGKYTVDWARSYTWNIAALNQKSLDIFSKKIMC